MRRVYAAVIGALVGVILATTVAAQGPFSAQIQQFYQALSNGQITMNTPRIVASGYLNFGATVGMNGYGIRDSAGTMQAKNSGGAWVAIAPSGGSAPADATYITQTLNATLTNEQAIASLATGFLFGTTTTGVISSIANPIPGVNGGTGLSTAAIGDLIYASATTPTWSRLADVAAGSYLRSGGVNTAPVWSTATLPNTATTGDVLYASASNVYSNRAAVASGSLFASAGTSTAPVWSTAPTLNPGPFTVQKDGIAITSTDGIVAVNTTAAATGAGNQQWSPRLRLQGNGWVTGTPASQIFAGILEVVPTESALGSGSFTFSLIRNVTTSSVFAATITSSGTPILNMGSTTGVYGWGSTNVLGSPTNGLFNVNSNAGSVGVQFNVGTAAPTVTSCGTGTVTTGSRNTAGQITATGATACTVTFGSPAWTNTPFCVVTEANIVTTAPYISAASTTAITVSGLTANDIFNYVCIGRI